ncbi:response regulator transcription factor [Sulfurospirillum arcachonense]|uniref:response regulator transcription factor n=1 Tax=Sulfurospirillum arcachonense TaxID=57666 RepID=UPI000469E48A|nr:winged helix-turn-helix domain-containing protein [Sulfurospirillum arcachonense]
MKIFLFESDTNLEERIVTCLNNYRLKFDVKQVQEEQSLFDEANSLDQYALFILNLKDPTDPNIMNFIRRNGSDAPILLILEAGHHADTFKTIYYHSYSDIIVKDFEPEEIMYKIYKLCDIWNDDTFFLNNGMHFDFKKATFVSNEEYIFLGKKEALLLKFLFVKSPGIATYSEILAYVYHNEIILEARVRALVNQLRNKLPVNLIHTVKGKGYQLLSKKPL